MSLAVDSPAFIRWSEPHRFPILRYRPAGDRDALAGQNLGNPAVAERRGRILLANELADLGADRGRGSPRAVAALDLAGEEIAQLEHPARGVHVLAGSHARDRGLVHAD